MGVRGKVLHAFKANKDCKDSHRPPGLDVRELKDLLRYKHPDHNGPFCVAVDVSHLAYQSPDMFNSAFFVAQSLVALGMAGFIVYPILDPDAGDRSHIKREHTKRVFESRKSEIKSTRLRLEAVSLRDGNEEDKARADTLMAESTKLEKKGTRRMPAGFESSLRMHLQETGAHHLEADETISPKEFDSGGMVQPIEMASVEADANVSRLILDSKCHAIVGIDNDYGILLPPDVCFLVSSFVVKKERGKMLNRKELWKIQSIEVKGTGKWMDDAWELFNQIWNSGGLSRVAYDRTPTPIFDSDDPCVRALAALLNGCDVLVGGAEGIGVKQIMGLLEEFRAETFCEAEVAERMQRTAMNKLHMNKDETDTFVNALLCAPANPKGGDLRRLYPDIVPRIFPQYLRDYAGIEDDIVPGPTTLQCVGPTTLHGQHVFMECEGSKTCSSCRKTICRTCTNEVSLDELPIAFLRDLVQKEGLDPSGERATLISLLQPDEEVDSTTKAFLSTMKRSKAELAKLAGSSGLDKISLICDVVRQDASMDESVLDTLKTLASMKKEELQEEIRRRNTDSGSNISTSGGKTELIERLMAPVENSTEGIANGISSICSTCYEQEVFLPRSAESVKSEQEMRKELDDAGIKLSADASGFEVIDSYYMMEALEEVRGNRSFEDVRFPERPASRYQYCQSLHGLIALLHRRILRAYISHLFVMFWMLLQVPLE